MRKLGQANDLVKELAELDEAREMKLRELGFSTIYQTLKLKTESSQLSGDAQLYGDEHKGNSQSDANDATQSQESGEQSQEVPFFDVFEADEY